jgi:hypothetical protein
MRWFVAKENLFDRYPDIQITADPFEPNYKIKYIECVKENQTVRFERKEKTVPKKSLERFISEVLENNG